MFILLKRFLKLVLFISCSWVLGFVAFFAIIPSNQDVSDDKQHVDVVVILTGDYLRLEKGVEVFLKTKANKILISGVPRKIPKKSVLRRIKKLSKVDINPDDLHLGHLADSTISNATETKIFMGLNGYKSLDLVTSNYHMPRSLYLFKRAMPNYKITYTAAGLNKMELVKTKWRYLITEYHKLVGTVAMNLYDDAYRIYYNALKSIAGYIRKN